MANGYNLGNAFVQIMPSFDGASASITQGLNNAMAGAGDAAGDVCGKTMASRIGSALSSAGKVIGSALVAGTTAAAGGLLAFGKSAVEAGSTFDASMSQVAATMGVTVDEIGDLRNFAQEMGSTTAFSASQAADALNYLALAGYKADESVEMLPTVLNLAAAGNIDLAYASDMVTDASSALGLEMDETALLVDKMAKTSSQSNTSVAQLGEAILTVGGTAKNLAGSTTELSTALGILADNGIKGAEGGTALRNIILSLSAPTDKAADLMEELGLEVFDAEGNMRPLNETFEDLNGILGTMSQQDQINVLNNMFNKVDLKSVNALLANSGERFDELSTAIDNCTGAAQAMAETQLDNLHGDVTILQSALEGLQIAVADSLTPSLREFVQFGSDGLSRLTEAFKTDGIQGAMDTLGDILGQGVTMIAEKVPDFMQAAVSLLMSVIDALVDNTPVILDAAIDAFMAIVEALPVVLPKVLEGIVSVISSVAAKLPELLPMILQAAIDTFLGLVEALPKILPELIQAVTDCIDAVITLLPYFAPQLLNAAISLFVALVESIPVILPQLLDSLGQLIASSVNAIANGFSMMFEVGGQLLAKLLEGISSYVGGVLDFFISLPGRIIGALGDAGSILWNAGSQIINGFLNGLMAAWDGVCSFIGGIGDWIVSHKGPEEYDKNLLVNAGELIMGGLNKGLEEGFGDIKSTVSDVNDFLGNGIKADACFAYNTSWSMSAAKPSGMSIPNNMSNMGGILITGNTFNVRSDQDIERISERLYEEIQRGSGW